LEHVEEQNFIDAVRSYAAAAEAYLRWATRLMPTDRVHLKKFLHPVYERILRQNLKPEVPLDRLSEIIESLERMGTDAKHLDTMTYTIFSKKEAASVREDVLSIVGILLEFSYIRRDKHGD
jgi:hypothetical protein